MNAFTINDKSLLDSYIEIEKLKGTLKIFIKRIPFTIRTKVECTDKEFDSLLSFLRKISNRQTNSLEWANRNNSFKIIAEYDTCTYNDIALRFVVITKYYTGSIHLDIGADYLMECINQDCSSLICHDNLSFLEGFEGMIDLSLKFIDKKQYEDCLNFNYELRAAANDFIVEKKISMLEEEYIDICEGIKELLSFGTPYAIKLPDSFDAFWLRRKNDYYILEDGWVADLEWKQNEIVFKRLLVASETLVSLYQSLKKSNIAHTGSPVSI